VSGRSILAVISDFYPSLILRSSSLLPYVIVRAFLFGGERPAAEASCATL
jgi:hypothetical protein